MQHLHPSPHKLQRKLTTPTIWEEWTRTLFVVTGTVAGRVRLVVAPAARAVPVTVLVHAQALAPVHVREAVLPRAQADAGQRVLPAVLAVVAVVVQVVAPVAVLVALLALAQLKERRSDVYFIKKS